MSDITIHRQDEKTGEWRPVKKEEKK